LQAGHWKIIKGGHKVDSLTEELRQLRENDPEIALVLDVFGEAERIYHEALEAMGVTGAPTLEVQNSAEVTVSFRPTASTTDQQ